MNKPRTLFDKIWDRHVIARVDDEVLLYVDRCIIHEGSNHAFETLRRARVSVRRPKQIFAFADHYVPTDPARRAQGLDGIADKAVRGMVELLQRNTREHGIALFGLGHERQGILHVAGPELGLCLPGIVLTGSDSHTSTHGAFGCLAFGIGASEAAHVLAMQALWQRRPANLRITIDGPLGFGVTAKDVIMAMIARIGVGGAIGHVIEYAGETIRRLSMTERMTVCNMSIEAGGRAGMIAPDETTCTYLAGRQYAPDAAAQEPALAAWRELASDADAAFEKEVSLDARAIQPMVSWGTNPEQALPISGAVPDPAREPSAERRAEVAKVLAYMGLTPGTPLQEIRIDRVFIGSCTNGRIEDLRQAAAVAKRGRAVVPSWVVPGSASVKREAEAEGLDRVFEAAGFEWREPGCSLCAAMNGDELRPGERCASTSNRNFPGRQGPGGRTHLLSPPMAAAAALQGRLVDVRRLGSGS